MKAASLASLRTLLVLGVLLVGQGAAAQGCDPSQSEFPAPQPDTDTIEIASYGGNLGGRAVVSLDASGSITVLPSRQCADQIKHDRADPSVFAESLAKAIHAIETVRNQPPRPDPSTTAELVEIMKSGRIEGLCLSALDGIDVDVTIYVNGVKSRYPCVTGELLSFGQGLLRLAFAAVEDPR